MRFLIVNGYSYCENGIRKFEEFRREIIKFISSQKELIDTENEYYIRDRENVEDFIYE